MPAEKHDWLNWLPIVLITLAALGMRTWALDNVPPGITHDEAAHLQDAKRIWEGYRPIYLSTAYGREPLFDYATAPLVGALGMSVTTGRLASAVWGTAQVVLAYAWVRRAFDRPTAILAAGLLALSFWPVATSRQILRSVTMPVLLVGAVAALWRGIYPPDERADRPTDRRTDRRRRLSRFLLAGVLLGLGWYTYMPARIMWVAPTLMACSLALTDKPRWRQVRGDLFLMLALMIVVAMPLVVHLARHPELEVRVAELAAPLRAMREGSFEPLWSRLRQTALMFSHKGDVQWIYNIAGRPLLPPVLAVLFYAGIMIAALRVARSRRPAELLLLVWLGLGVAPAMVTGLESSSVRAIAAQPTVYILTAIAAVSLVRVVARSGSDRRVLAAVTVVGAAGLLWLTASTANDYFTTWANHRDTRVAYHSHLTEMVEYAAELPGEPILSISTIYPGPLHDPYAAEVIAGDPGFSERTRWYDGRSALVFPDAERAVAVLPALAPLDRALAQLFVPYAHLVERVELQPDDLSPWFAVYRWEPRVARSALALDKPMGVGDVLALVGHELRTTEIAPGEQVELVTFWIPENRQPADLELVLFTHLVQGSTVVAQRDRLDVPPSSWRSGELFAQLHRFSVPDDVSPGLYSLECGAYLSDTPNSPLIVTDGGRPVGNAAVLGSVQIR